MSDVHKTCPRPNCSQLEHPTRRFRPKIFFGSVAFSVRSSQNDRPRMSPTTGHASSEHIPGRRRSIPACMPDEKGVPNFDTLHSRTADHLAVACAFDLLMVNGDDLRRQPLRARKLALGKLLLRSLDGIQYVEHAEGHGDRMFEPACRLGLEGVEASG